jgi:hypothetical protein
MNNASWFAKAFRILITTFVFGLYIALVFFSFRQNWRFLATFEYWVDTLTSTGLALMFRWLYSDSGIEFELKNNDDVAELEKGKGKLVSEINQKGLTDALEQAINKRNQDEKLKQYRNKCDRKINWYSEKAWYKFKRKLNLKKWKQRKEATYQEDFNIDACKVKYYRYDIDEMMSTFYKTPNGERNRRVGKNEYVVSSLRTNAITLIAFMVYNALQIFAKDYTNEELVVLAGKLIVFTVNIYTGFDLGKKYIRNIYSSNLTDDYVFLKGFISKQSAPV